MLRRLIIRLGLRHLGIGALQGDPVLPAEQVLREVDAVLVRGRGHAAVEGKGLVEDSRPLASHGLGLVRLPVVLFLGDRAAARDLRQQRRERLRLGFERGEPSGLGLLELRIVLQRALIDREQVGRRRGVPDQATGENESGTDFMRCYI